MTDRMPSIATMREGSPMSALPGRCRLTTLFVDIAGSTSLLIHHPPEAVLGVVQCFLGLVSDVALVHGGKVKDYEGDGALLYFEKTRDAVTAAFAIQLALAQGRCDGACGGGPGVRARMSITVGDVVVGVVGYSARQAIALVGPSVNIGARILKQAPLSGIITTREVVEVLRQEAPGLADEFELHDDAFAVPGASGATVTTYVSSELSRSRARCSSAPCS